MINIVVVSHSALLARGVEQLARQMMRGDGCKLALAAGVDDEQHPIGTDAVKVMEAIEAVADGDGVLVLMDWAARCSARKPRSICWTQTWPPKCGCVRRRWSKARWRRWSPPTPAPRWSR